MFDRVIRWSLINRAIVVMAYVILMAAGIFMVRRMTLDVFPEFAPPQVVIQTEAPGLSPGEVETLITFPIESAINGTPGVDLVRSRSSVGLSTVVVIFQWGTDIYTARQLVNERLQLATGRFPVGTQSPVMLPITSAVGWLVKYALTSETISALELRTISDWEIRPRLLAIPGVASVVSIGGGVKQYQVLLNSERLLYYDVSVKNVVEAIRKTNVNVPGGFFVMPGQEFVVTGVGRVRSLEDLKQTVITEREGTPLLLSQVAEVRFGPEVKRGDASFNAKPAVIGTVSKLFGTDTLTVTYEVEKVLDGIKKTIPPGVEMNTEVFRQATFIEAAIQNLRGALIQVALIVSIVIVFVLFNLRAAFVSLTAMPISLLAGIMILRYFGVGINAMTLGGMAIAVGDVVDDAIVDVENVFRRLRENRQKGNPLPPLQVIFLASREIRNSIVYATFIALIVFVPIFLLTGIEGRIFTPLGMAYFASVGCSLLVALTLTPVLCSFLLVRAPGREGPEKESPTLTWMKGVYEQILRRVIHHPRWVITLSLLLVGMALVMFYSFGRSFLPEFHEGNFILAVTTLPGTSLDESMRLGGRIVGVLKKYPEVVSVSQRAGRAELDEDAMPPNFSEFDITLRYGERSPDELVRAIREDLEKVPGIAINLGQFIAHRLDEVLSGVRAQVAIKIYGPDLALLREKGKEVETILRGVKGVTDLQREPQIDVPEIRVTIKREEAARLGLNVEDIAETVQVAFNGTSLSQVIEGQRSFDLFVWFDEASRTDLEAMRGIFIDTREGKKVPLRMVANVGIENRPYFINREKVQRRIVVQFNVVDRDLGGLIREVQERVHREVTLPPGYFVEYGGQFESQQEATRILTIYGIFSVIGIFVILFKAFNGSARSAVLVMVNLPLAVIGGVISIFLTGRVISVASLMGFITLFGIAARNGIILISHYRALREQGGRSQEEIIIEGSQDRLAPVLMTAGNTFLGLIPLVVGELAGKELEKPLAQVILGGLFSSTLLNLVIVPTLFLKYGWEKEEEFQHQQAMEREELGEFLSPGQRVP